MVKGEGLVAFKLVDVSNRAAHFSSQRIIAALARKKRLVSIQK